MNKEGDLNYESSVGNTGIKITNDKNDIDIGINLSNNEREENVNDNQISIKEDDFIQSIMKKIRNRKEALRSNLDLIEKNNNIEKEETTATDIQINKNSEVSEEKSNLNKLEAIDLSYEYSEIDDINGNQKLKNFNMQEGNLSCKKNSKSRSNLDLSKNVTVENNISKEIDSKTSDEKHSKNISNIDEIFDDLNFVNRIENELNNEEELATTIKEDIKMENNILNNLINKPQLEGERQSISEEDSETELHKEVNDSIVSCSNKLFSMEKIEKIETKIKSSKHNSKNNGTQNQAAVNKYNPSNANIIVDEVFLQKIEETEIEKEKELQQNMEEIHTIESGLKLDERLMHEKWQIRKNAYKEVSDLILLLCEKDKDKDSANIQERNQMLETFSPWLKYFITDTNLTSLGEGLNTFSIYITYSIENRSRAMNELFDELEKIITHNKLNINEICHKIINISLNNKKSFNSTINELIKKMNSNNTKVLLFIQRIFLDLISNCYLKSNNENINPYVKLIMEKSILNYSSSLSSKNIERKKIFAKIIQEIYSVIEDEYEIVKKNVNMTNQKDIEKVMKGVKKRNDGKRLILYHETYTNAQLGRDSSPLIVEKKNNSDHHHPSQEAKISNMKTLPPEVNDLLVVIPDEFFEIAYCNQFNKKKEILEKTNKLLSQVTNIRDKEKDNREIFSNLNYAIDDSNVLVHSEGIRCLTHLARLLKMSINQSKLKLLLYCCFDKYKDKKSLVKMELHILFDTLLMNYCFSVDYFVNFTISYLITQKNPIIRLCLLEYIKQLFGGEISPDEVEGGMTVNNDVNIDRVKLSSMTNSVEANSFVNFSKSLAEVMLNESQSNIKDICTDLIMIFKTRVIKKDKNAEEKFKKVIDSLPSYRKNIISSGKNDYNSNDKSEREYKMNLKKIKSNLSFRNNTSTSHSKSRDNRFNLNTSNYESNNSKMGILLTKNNRSMSKDVNNLNRNNSKSNLGGVKNTLGREIKKDKNVSTNNNKITKTPNKFSSLTTPNKENKNDSNQSDQPNQANQPNQLKNQSNSYKIKEDFDNKKKELIDKIMRNKAIKSNKDSIINKNNSINNIKPIKMHDDKETSLLDIDNKNDLLDSQRSNTTNTTNITMLEKRMESAIEHIYSLDKIALYEYTKKVIKDFLIFVKNVSSKQLKEDLESHFNVIINILNKIWERINAFNRNKNFQIPEELFIQSLKVVIVAPCFIDPKENGKGRIYHRNLLPFMEYLRTMIENDEKLFHYYLDIISKFVNLENKGTSFLENVNPRATFVIFLDYFTKNDKNCIPFDLENMNVVSSIIEIIEKSAFLSEYEKNQYLNKFESYLNNQKQNEMENEEIVEEMSSIIQDENIQQRNFAKLESSLIKNIKTERDDDFHSPSSSPTQLLSSNQYNNFDNEFTNLNNPNLLEQHELKIKYKEIENISLKQIGENEKFKERLDILNKNKKEYEDKIIRNDEMNKNEKLKERPNLKQHQPQFQQQYTYEQEKNNIQMLNQMNDKNIPGINLININEDISDIKDKIKQKVRKLDMTIQRLGDKIERRTDKIEDSKKKVLLDESITNDISLLNAENKNKQKPIRSLQDFYEEEKSELSENYVSANMKVDNKMIKNYPIYNNLNPFDMNNLNTNPIINKSTPSSCISTTTEEDMKNLILKIPTNLLDNNIGEIALYVKLESLFKKLSNDQKLIFSNELNLVLENNSLIRTSSFNCFLQLFEFLLNLLTQQIILNSVQSSKDIQKSPLIKLQEIIENLLKKKEISEIFKILIYLLRKFLPKDFYYSMDKESLVMLKSISYLMKTCIEMKINSNFEFNSLDILHEINELFVYFPPTNLREGVPNLEFLDKIYKQLRLLTDLCVRSNTHQAKQFIDNSKKRNKSSYCVQYIYYLESIINN